MLHKIRKVMHEIGEEAIRSCLTEFKMAIIKDKVSVKCTILCTLDIHDVSFVYSCNFLSPLHRCIVKSKFSNSFRFLSGDHFDHFHDARNGL